MKRILALRFSALGDVAMCVPVVKAVLAQNPAAVITFVSQPFVAPLFEGIERLQFVGADVQKEYRGMGGLWQLAKQLRKERGGFDDVADLHGVLRTAVLRNFLRLQGCKVAQIEKGRQDKRRLTKKENKQLHPLKTSFERYADVFRNLGCAVALDAAHTIISNPSAEAVRIGIAPLARHTPKVYPLAQMAKVVELLSGVPDAELILFGGKAEAPLLQTLVPNGVLNVRNLAGTLSLGEELELMGTLTTMVSMDSANMHLASHCGVPVVSVWGATHPYAGFYGWGQDPANAIGIPLYCRPCSTFGNKPCHRGDHACMHAIAPEAIVACVKEIIAQHAD